MTQHVWRCVGRHQLYLPLFRQGCNLEVKQRLRDGHVNMYRGMTDNECLVDQAVTVPTFLVIMRLRQGNGLTDEAPKGIGLRKRLSVELVNPRLRTALMTISG